MNFSRTIIAVLLPAIASSALSALGAARSATISVQVDKPSRSISPWMWGVFFEDINFAADGGLYAELVKNRSFEFPDHLMGWNKIPVENTNGSLEILDLNPFNTANPHYLRLKTDSSEKDFGVCNEGFRGMGIREEANYIFSTQIRAVEGSPKLLIELVGSGERQIAEVRLENLSHDWTARTITFRATATEPKAQLHLYIEGAGTIDLDMVSLFPENTWKNRPNGLRPDLVQMLADLKPSFIKFPGGFLTEGRQLETRYQWKTTLGALPERKLLINAFNRFGLRSAPDYFQSFGLGFFEYFQLCEDLGAEPQPVLSCGMAAQFTGAMVPLDQLEPYIQDVLDLIEFANGPATSPWGTKRANMGHPAPFNLKMIRLGNEQHGPRYVERCERILGAIKAKHPEITLIAGTGPDPAGDGFKFAWDNLGNSRADIMDEHSHNQPNWFFGAANRFDTYDRRRSKVMVGEYCAHTMPGLIHPDNRNNLESALSEAAFLTGLERNADVVVMASACALFAHTDAWQWTPNLIWFDNLRVYGTPNYYVQQLFSLNRGNVILPVELKLNSDSFSDRSPGLSARTPTQQDAFLYVSATHEKASGEVIFKVVNSTVNPLETEVRLNGTVHVDDHVIATVLTSGNSQDENSFEQPNRIVPKTSQFEIHGKEFRHIFPAISLTVLRIKTK